MKKYTLLLILVSLFSQQAYANPFLYGPGTGSCGGFLKDLRRFEMSNDPLGHYINRSWVDGFVSASGWYGATMKDVDTTAREAFITKYCKENPLDSIADGAKALVEKLETKK